MRSRLAVAAGLVLALALSACNKHDVVTHGGTEGIYVDVGPVKYQVQNSRLLNPDAIAEDRTFVSGVSAADARLASDEGWFVLFVRAQNEDDEPARLASEFEIRDADGHVYEPVALSAHNPFRYVRGSIDAESVAPDPDSVGGQLSTNGLELLFKVKYAALDESRPFVLHIRSPGQGEAEVDLDI